MTIIPVGGGKGGIGKSLLTANLAIALAEAGSDVVAVDLDLGNSNLHTLLGLPNSFAGSGEWLKGQVESPLHELCVATPLDGLRFLAGDGRMPLMADVSGTQLERLLHGIRSIEADFVLLDLSAGTARATLDLCLLGPSPLLVTTPDRASVSSALVFMKNLLVRAVDRTIGRDAELADALRPLYVQSVADPTARITPLIGELMRRDPEAARRLDRLCERIRPRLVLNQGDDSEDLDVLATIARSLDRVLNLEADHVGFVPFDQEVRRAGRKTEAFILRHPDAPAAQAIYRIASRIRRFWHHPIDRSAERLAHATRMALGAVESPTG